MVVLFYNYLCNQCLSPLIFLVWISIRARCTTLCDKVCQLLPIGSPVSSTNKTDRHEITEILLKVALNTIKQTNKLFSTIFRLMEMVRVLYRNPYCGHNELHVWRVQCSTLFKTPISCLNYSYMYIIAFTNDCIFGSTYTLLSSDGQMFLSFLCSFSIISCPEYA